jgi:hypothetical protein
MNKFSLQARQRCATVRASLICRAGAENTVSEPEVYTATLSAVSLRPKFMVLDVKVLPIRKDGSMAGSMFSPPSRPFCVPEKRPEWLFKSQPGAETMTTVNTPTTPKTGNPGTKPTLPAFTQIGRILRDRVVHRPPPKLDPIERQQAIENALSAALWHVRKESNPAALQAATGRAIRAASMLKQACAEATNGGRA